MMALHPMIAKRWLAEHKQKIGRLPKRVKKKKKR